jgi:hypothetical protein
MLSRIATIFLVFVLSLGAPVYICATSPVAEESLLPEQEAIDNAARLPDPVARESALREAIRKGLLETRPEVATEVLGYLGEHSRWLDVRPFEDIITEYGRSNNPTSRNVGWFLDSIELARMSRERRLRLYSAAIVDGSTTLRHGWPLLRQSAMLLASYDGLAELRPLIETHYPEETAQVREHFPLPELIVRLGLGAGAADREDASRLASERLDAMKDGDFRDRMNKDAAFAQVVDEIATYVCTGDAFAPRRNPGCASIKDIVTRQLVLETGSPQGADAADKPCAKSMQEYQEWFMTWLGRMQQSSRGEPSVQRPH